MEEYLAQLRKQDTAWKGGGLAHRKEMFAMVKRVASQEGLSLALTNDLLMTIAGESGFNAKCVNWDSYDFGICQFSRKYYLKEYKMTPQEAIENPEKCCRIMCVNFKAGRQSNWVAYANRKQHAGQLIELSEPPKPILEETRKNIENAQAIVPSVVESNTPIIQVKTGILYLLITACVNFIKKVLYLR